MTEEEKNLIKLQHFMAVDLHIKNELLRMAPPHESEAFNQDSLVKYSDDFYKTLKYIKSEMMEVLVDMGLQAHLSSVNNIFKYWEDRFIQAGINYNSLKKFYKECISDMSPLLINKVKQECVGYMLFKNIESCFRDATTLNEVLHVIHASILNSEVLYQSLPKKNIKQNAIGENITLYGVDNEIGKSIFERFPVDLDASNVDIVCVNDNKIMIMIRDLGHALTIEMDIDGNSIHLNYFIPKICNIEMVNKLKGINPVREDASVMVSANGGATGAFETTKDKLTEELFEFLKMVPTDRDMEILRR